MNLDTVNLDIMFTGVFLDVVFINDRVLYSIGGGAREPIVAVPTLNDLVTDPAKATDLPPTTAHTLYGQAVLVLAALLPSLTPSVTTAQPDDVEVIGLDDAAKALAMKPGTLYRKWKTLGIGYLDADGHVKFNRATLRRYIARKGG